MGLRGPLPALKLIPAPKLSNLTAPDWLSNEARSFWDKHSEHLSRNNLLTTATADSFAVLCDLWSRIRSWDGDTTRLYLDTIKSYESFAKFFRVIPCDKPGVPTARHDDKDEFDF